MLLSLARESPTNAGSCPRLRDRGLVHSTLRSSSPRPPVTSPWQKEQLNVKLSRWEPRSWSCWCRGALRVSVRIQILAVAGSVGQSACCMRPEFEPRKSQWNDRSNSRAPPPRHILLLLMMIEPSSLVIVIHNYYTTSVLVTCLMLRHHSWYCGSC